MRRRYLSIALAASLLFSSVGIHGSVLGFGARTAYADEVVVEDADAMEVATDIAEEDPLVSSEREDEEETQEESDLKEIDTVTNLKYEEKSDGTVKITGLNVVSANVPADGVLTIPDKINVEGEDKVVTEIGSYAFDNSSYLDYKKKIKKIVIPSSVESIGYASFSGFLDVTEIEIPNGVVTIDNYAFRKCSSLKSVKFPKTVRTIDIGAFYDCTSLESVEFPKDLLTLGSDAFYGCTKLNSVNLSELSVNNIPSSCFRNCTSLKRIVCSDDLKVIGYNAFDGCTSVDNIYLGENLSEIGSRAFANTAITEIRIPRSLMKVGREAFDGCDKLTKARFADKSREVPANLFYGCEGLKDVVLPSTISIIGDYAFYKCKALDAIDIPECVYSIGDYAFYGCENIKTIKLGEEFEELGYNAFAECSSLKSINLDGAITSIPSECFYGTALENVVCSYRLTSIGSRAFANNPALKSVTLSAMTKDIYDNAFDQESLTICSAPSSRAAELAESKGYTFKEGQKTTKLTLSETGTIATAMGGEKYIDISFEPANSLDEITWSSSDESVATVEPDKLFPTEGVVKGLNAGNAVITVSMGSCTAKCDVVVEDALSNLEFSSSIFNISSLKNTLDLKRKLRYKGGDLESTKLIWKSSKEDIAIVSGDGLIVPKRNGTTEITVSDVKGYATASCYVKVTTPVYPESISFDRSELLITGKPRMLNLKVYPEDANQYKAEWTTEDPDIATVNTIGQVTGVSEGETTVTASVRGESGDRLEATCKVKVKYVKNPVTGIVISENSILLGNVGSEAVLTAYVTPSDADIKDILWSSDNEKAAVVDANGKVRATGVGEAVITAESMDGGYTASCVVKVEQKIQSITMDKEYLLLDKGESAVIGVKVMPAVADDSMIEIYSTNRNIASVTKNTVTGVSDGIAWIRCRAKDGSNAYATCKVYVGTSRNEAPQNGDSDKDADKKDGSASANQIENVLAKGQKLDVSKYFTTANIKKFKVNSKKIATVNKKGILKGKKSGEVTVEAYVKGASGWEMKESHKFKVEVPKFAKKPTMKAGDKVDIKTLITGVTDLKPSKYEVKNKSVADIDGEGIITAKKAGKTKITVYYGDGKAAGKIKVGLKVN